MQPIDLLPTVLWP